MNALIAGWEDRQRWNSWGQALQAHLVRWGWAWAALVAAILAFNAFFKIGVNVSSSLPGHVYVVIKGDRNVKRGDLAAFHWNGRGPYKHGLTFLKIVRGLPGDRVSAQGRDFYVNGVYAGTAKIRSREGLPLEAGPTGVIPPGRYYVHAPHKDSLDSRYALTSWVSGDDIVGRAVVIF